MKFFLILIYFLIEEMKLNLKRLKFIYNFFKEFSIPRYLLYLVNNSFIPSKDKVFRNYIHRNSQKWKDQNSSKNSNNKNVLIPRFDSELIIDILKQYPYVDDLLEIGTGSGNLAITIAKENLAKNIIANKI